MKGKLRPIPTIDISDGRAVLVKNGVVVRCIGDPYQLAKKLSVFTTFQVTDLDRVVGKGDNREIIFKICRDFTCYVAGGIRCLEDASEYLNASAKRVTVGTSATVELLSQLHKKRLVVAFDVDDSYNLLFKGRTEKSCIKLFDRLEEVASHIEMMCLTFHNAEGCGNGIPMDQVREVKAMLDARFPHIFLTVAGGIKSIEEIKELMKMGINPQFGEGLWTGKFSRGQVLSAMLNSEKQIAFTKSKNGEPLFPVAVIKKSGRLLGIVYTSQKSLEISVDSGVATFYSRERNELWTKGATSGFLFSVFQVVFNCDFTSVVMVVNGDKFCHLENRESCFSYRDPNSYSIAALMEHIQQRMVIDGARYTGYSQRLMSDPFMVRFKLGEEVEELQNAPNRSVIHEVADVFFFLTLFMLQKGLTFEQVTNELALRRYLHAPTKYKLSPLQQGFCLGVCFQKSESQNARIYHFAREIGLDLELDTAPGVRSMRYICTSRKNPQKSINVLSVKPKDVYKAFYNGLIHAVVCYDDVVRNYPVNVKKWGNGGTGDDEHCTKVVVVGRLSDAKFLIDEARRKKERKLRIATEYPLLTDMWLAQENLNAKLMTVNGGAENYVDGGFVDLCVCVCDTGETIRAHDLHIIAELGVHPLGLYYRPDAEDEISELV